MKTLRSLDIHPVQLDSLLGTLRKLGSLASHSAHSKNSNQPGESSLGEINVLVVSCSLIYCEIFCKHHNEMFPKSTTANVFLGDTFLF